jgi:hypothetical protein
MQTLNGGQLLAAWGGTWPTLLTGEPPCRTEPCPRLPHLHRLLAR